MDMTDTFSAPHQDAEFQIRPIEAQDWEAVRDAVISNDARLAADFPLLDTTYRNADNARARVSDLSALTANPNSGFDVWVAKDDDKILGMGTRLELGKRALYLLGLTKHLHSRDVSLVAGWTTREHPTDLPLLGLTTLIDLQKPSNIPDSPAYAVTLIREPNKAAQSVAKKAGMHKLDGSLLCPDPTVGPLRLRAAGINDGVQIKRRLWVRKQVNHKA